MKKIIVAIAIICIVSCIEKKDASIQKLNWLIGSWLYVNQDNDSIYEQWNFMNNDIIFGTNYSIKNDIKTIYETIKITSINDTIYYNPRVYFQNNGQEIHYKSVIINDSTMIFINKSHDFPQKIQYNKLNEKLLEVTISGEVNGVNNEIVFNFIKI